MTEASPLVAAQERFVAAVPQRCTGAQTCALQDALGRTLFADLVAPGDSPPYARAIVEGWLVNTADTREASEGSPVAFRIVAEVKPGAQTSPTPGVGEAIQVSTGSIVPEGAYSIVRQWEAQLAGDAFTISRPFPPRFFIEERGCDLKAGTVVASAGTVLGPADLGNIAALGIGEVEVAREPVVALFSSGDEVIAHTELLRPGLIRDCNAVMLSAAVRQAGAVPRFQGIMKDDFDAFVAKAKAALGEADMIVISGGTAVGGRDYISDLVRALGELIVDGVPMRSGRPLIMGVAQGKPIVCVAGHPPEALRGFRLFGAAAIDRMLGRDVPLPADAPAA